MLFSKPLGFAVASITLLLPYYFFLFQGSLDIDSLRFLHSRSKGALRSASMETTAIARSTTTTVTKSCLDANGPQPFILMSIGRSGSGSTFQILTNLTGKESPAEEYTGSNPINSKRFLIASKTTSDGGSFWVTDNLCKKQTRYPDAGIVGFKWKPWKSIYSPAALNGLKFIAQSQNPTVKIVRLRRNLLDVYLSIIEHRLQGVNKAHCATGDEECFRKHREAGTNVTISVDDTLEYLESMTKQEDDVDALLDDMNVPHVHVTYDKMYHTDTAEEWMKVFAFLGVGPEEGLTRQQVSNAMGMKPTSNPRHKDSVFNFDELREALTGTKYEGLLHL